MATSSLLAHYCRHQYDAAEALYRRAIASDPRHANSLYNYAVLLDSIRRDAAAAEGYYVRALEVHPLHSFANYNYAGVLHVRSGEGGFLSSGICFSSQVVPFPSPPRPPSLSSSACVFFAKDSPATKTIHF